MMMQMNAAGAQVCGAATMNAASVNMHFHGTNTAPVCHQDEVIHTLINSGETFTYNVKFPADEPPGLYWYHPHVHGLSEAAVQGGASGAIIVQGIQNLQPAVAGMPQRLLIIRDQIVPDAPDDSDVPAWDLSLNYVPISYPQNIPAVLPMKRGNTELWRVLNASADAIIDLQLDYDGVPQTLGVVALDGVPTGSQDGTRRGTVVNMTSILMPPAARAEFIVTAPPPSVHNAVLKTLNVDTGPDGDNDPERPLGVIQLSDDAGRMITAAGAGLPALPSVVRKPGRQRFEGLREAAVTATRKLFFSEVIPPDPDEEPTFFITVDGQTPVAFSPDNPPAITTTRGAVEEWTIENRSGEAHEFHMHQIHFLLEKINGVPVPPEQQQFLDMINIPFWSGSGPYPSVTVRMDFRGKVVGDFVYHCHILEHEDHGMMAIIRVLPQGAAATAAHSATARRGALVRRAPGAAAAIAVGGGGG
jgi:FtsP/CotA-like multicopper oxidase with cupredoxin domain